MAESKTLVLGIGNSFRRDDGVGPAVINRLNAEVELAGEEAATVRSGTAHTGERGPA